MKSEPIYTFTQQARLELQLDGPVLHALNKAWGFEDGKCNEWKNGVLVPKPLAERPEYVEAVRRLLTSRIVEIDVAVYKDGSATVSTKG